MVKQPTEEGYQQQGGRGHGGSPPQEDLNQALLDVFKDLVTKLGRGDANTPTEPVLATIKACLEIRSAMEMGSELERLEKERGAQQGAAGAKQTNPATGKV